MKVNIGPYTNWVGPYQIAEMLCWWVKEEKDEFGIPRKPNWVHNFGTWLGERKDGSDSLLLKVCQWVESKKKRKIKVHIDRWDTWGMDHTLAHIILPMLKQLKATKHGSHHVDLEDVPEYLQGTSTPDYSDQLTFEFYDEDRKDRDVDYELVHKRWDWVLDEMIQAFECKVSDTWEDQYRSGEHDLKSVPCKWDEDGKPTLYTLERGPLDTYQCDYEALRKHELRNQNGFRLFGKYYQGLWD